MEVNSDTMTSSEVTPRTVFVCLDLHVVFIVTQVGKYLDASMSWLLESFFLLRMCYQMKQLCRFGHNMISRACWEKSLPI